MLDTKTTEFILKAITHSFIFTQTHAYHQEIVDGETKNKIWSFMTAAALLPTVFEPLAVIRPDLYVGTMQFVFSVLTAGLYYVASIAHQNQIYTNQDELDKIIPLPLNCHNNKLLMKAVLWLSLSLDKIVLPLYVIGLIACIYLGSPLYGYTSIIMYGINLLNQHGYFPTFLKTPYMYLNVFVMTSYTFGIDSWFNIAVTGAGIAFIIYDYIRCNLLNKASPTAQFPMGDPQKKFEVPQIAVDDDHTKEQLTNLILQHRKYKSVCATQAAKIRFGFPQDKLFAWYCHLRGQPIEEVSHFMKHILFHETLDTSGSHVTFNHFYESHQIIAKLLEGAPPVDYDDYIRLFDQIDFSSPDIQDSIRNQMSLHDKFNKVAPTDWCSELKLPDEASLVEIQIAYLKREMSFFVDRMHHPSHRDLTAEQVAVMHRYARLILTKINTLPLSERHPVLLTIAICTGSHCNRIYLETLSSMAEDFGFLVQENFSLRERAMIALQASRETAFRNYYYATIKQLKSHKESIYRSMFKTIFEDTDDYHTYEIFVQMFGANFYLRNPTLTLRYRTTREVYRDETVHYSLTKLHYTDEKMLFSQIYNADYLITQIVTPGTKLHTVFVAWCAEHFPSCYQSILYDEYSLLRKDHNVTTLAELMLLNLGVLELDAPYPAQEISFMDLAKLRLPCIVNKEIQHYFDKHKNPQDRQSYRRIDDHYWAVKRDGVPAIWELIRDKVQTQMLEEFDMLFTDPNQQDFVQLFAEVQSIPLKWDSMGIFMAISDARERIRKTEENINGQDATQRSDELTDYEETSISSLRRA
jgi:hypothetical protein